MDVAVRLAAPVPMTVGPVEQQTTVPADLLARLDQARCLAGRPRTITPLEGGLTNVNLKVETPDGRFVARLAGQTGSLLAIDRQAEHQASVAAASTGIAPEVVEYLPAAGVLVIRWIDGRTLAPADLTASVTLARVTASVRRLHAAPRFAADFDMFEVQRRYLEIVRREGYRLPARYLDFLPQAERIRTDAQ